MHECFQCAGARRLAAGLLSLVGFWGLCGAALAQSSPSLVPESSPTASTTQAPIADASSAPYVDGIAAVVNHQVITFSRLDEEVRSAQVQLSQQGIPAPDHETLRKQVLQRLIMQTLEAQEADRLNIRVTDAQIQQAVASIAQRNQLSIPQLRQALEQAGVPWEDYLRDLTEEVRTSQLRQQAVENLIHISEADVDAYLRSQAQRANALQVLQPAAAHDAPLGLAQILIAVPEGASAARVQTLREQAQAVLAQLRAGANFAGLAAAVSNAPDALSGGDLGVRPEDGWPDLFLNATQGLQPGQVSEIVQSGLGFHILLVTTRGATPTQAVRSPQPEEPQGPMLVTQTHARHILIKTSAVVSDEQARTRLEQLAQRMEHGGETFESLARRYSQDASAPQGGDLGWLSPGETVPPFEQAMDKLSDGQISEPVQSPFGWHLIQVLERRTRDMEDEYRRVQARQTLFQRRADPAYEEWLNRLREQAYIDNRLEPQPNRLRR